MKTFNSFFKSANAMTTLAIAAIALTSVFGFTSCDKDNEAFDNGPKPQKIEVKSETFGNKTTTTVTTGSGTTTTTITCGATTDTENMVKLTAKDYAGTYKCTSDDGKEWMIVLTENATASEDCYSATITVPEGEEVAAKTYDGYFKVLRNSAFFYSTGTKGGTDNNNLVNFKLDNSKDNSKNHTAIIKFNYRSSNKTLVFVKQ